MSVEPVNAEPLSLLRGRTSEKWRRYGPDVLPLFVAEMDFPLAEPVAEALIDRIRASDTGYAGSPGELPAAFADFAARAWGWQPPEAGIRTTTDVSVAIVELLRTVVGPGDAVVINPPVYPPFTSCVREAGGRVVEVPLVADGDGDLGIDLDGLEQAFDAGGVKAYILCHPHNPVGVVHPAAVLRRVAELAELYDVLVISDEIHAPLTHAGGFTPFLSVCDEAREVGITVTSASKGWNLAGLKCALMVAESTRGRWLLGSLPAEVGFRTSLLGLHGSVAAFRDGGPWLAGVMASLAANRRLLTDLLAEHLPEVGYREPDATYLAWLDLRRAGWGESPGARALAAGVALSDGPTFGAPGRGHARLNFACSPEVLTEAVQRLARA